MSGRVIIVVACALITAACDKAQLLAPSESTITLSTAATAIPTGGSTTITAMVIEPAGTPVQNGTTVRFTTNLGRIDPAEAQTRNGVATATFIGENAGLARITASSGGATATDSGNVVTVAVGTAAVENLALQASPSRVSAAGGTVTVTANVFGADNAPLRGVPVTFSASAGTLSATTATTDANGQASVQLTTNRESVVTARSGAEADEVTIEVNALATVTLAATAASAGLPTTLVVDAADGTAPRVTINWGDGSTSDIGIVTDSGRTVTHVYSQFGTYTITATATDNGDTTTTSTSVTVAARPAPTVTASAATVATNGSLTFTITPPTGVAVSNITVDFGDGSTPVDLGAITAATQVSHQFTTAGQRTVRAILTDANGNTSTGVVLITVT